jgi:hypothetical protein
MPKYLSIVRTGPDPIPPGCGKDTQAAVKARLDEATALIVASDASYKAASEADDQIAALTTAKAVALASAKSDAGKAAKLMAEAKAAMDRVPQRYLSNTE